MATRSRSSTASRARPVFQHAARTCMGIDGVGCKAVLSCTPHRRPACSPMDSRRAGPVMSAGAEEETGPGASARLQQGSASGGGDYWAAHGARGRSAPREQGDVDDVDAMDDGWASGAWGRSESPTSAWRRRAATNRKEAGGGGGEGSRSGTGTGQQQERSRPGAVQCRPDGGMIRRGRCGRHRSRFTGVSWLVRTR